MQKDRETILGKKGEERERESVGGGRGDGRDNTAPYRAS